MAIRKEDIIDSDFVDSAELAADGYTNYVSGVTVVSTTSSTKEVVVSGFSLLYDDTRVEAGDIIILSGNAAAGTYTVASVSDNTKLVVAEAIVSSTGGSAAFRYVPGAKKIGFNPSGLTSITSTNVQDALKELATEVDDLDGYAGGNGISENEHTRLRQLIHFIDSGPAKGFTSGAYQEINSTISLIFPTSVIWWESNAKSKKIVEQAIVWSGIVPSQITWTIYDIDGSTALNTVIDDIVYTNNIFEKSRTRTII